MRKDVFISYTSLDKECALEIVDYLESAGIDCFIAPRDIDAGRPYASNIMDAISDCRVAVLISSCNINGSEHVLNEVDVLFSKKKKLIPFFLEDFEMSDDFRYYIGRKQRIIAYPEDRKTYYSKLLEAIIPEISAKKKTEELKILDKTDQASKQQTIFEYIPARGIMINPEDYQRNVSFRTDTLINMLGGIYKDIVDMIGETEAKEIFYRAGYHSGKNFARRLCDKWNNESLSIEDKLIRWCKFDSCVGWGKFDIKVEIDEENGSLEGKLIVNECFIVDKRSKCKICAFMNGYCESIIETICGEIQVDLKCIECPMKKKFKTACVLQIKMKEE